jgi:hypothetical protein
LGTAAEARQLEHSDVPARGTLGRLRFPVRGEMVAQSPAAGGSGGPMFYHRGGLWGLLVLIADIWALVNIFQSNATTGNKVLWAVIVIILPVLGFILWLLLGPKTARA